MVRMSRQITGIDGIINRPQRLFQTVRMIGIIQLETQKRQAGYRRLARRLAEPPRLFFGTAGSKAVLQSHHPGRIKPAGLFQTVPLLINFVRLFLRLRRPQAFIQVLACRSEIIILTFKGIHTGVVQFVLGTEYAFGALVHILHQPVLRPVGLHFRSSLFRNGNMQGGILTQELCPVKKPFHPVVPQIKLPSLYTVSIQIIFKLPVMHRDGNERLHPRIQPVTVQHEAARLRRFFHRPRQAAMQLALTLLLQVHALDEPTVFPSFHEVERSITAIQRRKDQTETHITGIGHIHVLPQRQSLATPQGIVSPRHSTVQMQD